MDNSTRATYLAIWRGLLNKVGLATHIHVIIDYPCQFFNFLSYLTLLIYGRVLTELSFQSSNGQLLTPTCERTMWRWPKTLSHMHGCDGLGQHKFEAISLKYTFIFSIILEFPLIKDHIEGDTQERGKDDANFLELAWTRDTSPWL